MIWRKMWSGHQKDERTKQKHVVYHYSITMYSNTFLSVFQMNSLCIKETIYSKTLSKIYPAVVITITNVDALLE